MLKLGPLLRWATGRSERSALLVVLTSELICKSTRVVDLDAPRLERREAQQRHEQRALPGARAPDDAAARTARDLPTQALENPKESRFVRNFSIFGFLFHHKHISVKTTTVSAVGRCAPPGSRR